MKHTIFFLTLAASMTSLASEAVFKDKAARRFSKSLAGQQLVCEPNDDDQAKKFQKGFFPITISAESKGATITKVTVLTEDKKQSPGYGGDEIDPIEVTDTTVILSIGDDGRNTFFLPNMESSPEACDAGLSPINSAHSRLAILKSSWDEAEQELTSLVCCLTK